MSPAISQRFLPLLDRACAGDGDARRWVLSLYAYAMAVDHVADADADTPDGLVAALVAPVFDWPLNPFWTRFAPTILPVLSTAFASWMRSNEASGPKCKSAAVFTDSLLAVAFIRGGLPLVQELAGAVHAIAEETIVLDDLADGGKK